MSDPTDDKIIRTLRSWLKPCFKTPTCPYCERDVSVSATTAGLYVCDNDHWMYSRSQLKDAHWYNRIEVIVIAAMLIVFTQLVMMAVERAHRAITANPEADRK